MDDLASMGKYAREFIQSVHKLTQIPLRKLERYGSSNNLMNVLERPFALEPTALQLKKLDQAQCLSSGLSNPEMGRGTRQASHTFPA